MDPNTPSGSLKISLKLGQKRSKAIERQSSFQQQCPFQLMKESLPPQNRLLGSKNLISTVGLSESYRNYCTPGKLKPDLASYLPQLSHTQNLCSSASSSISLRQLIEKPPVTGRPIVLPSNLKGFQLTPGPVAEAYQLFDTRDVHKLLTAFPTNSTAEDDYDEFGKNFNDPEEVKKAHRRKTKRTLDEIESVLIPEERRPKKHKKDKKKNKKDKRRDKKDDDEPGTSMY
uniref:Mediator of RNA polymerase II transcription subunit 19 n=2 Tax=Panagrolaimus sp. JU765 TaxID=591449 RepID=A0AC34QN02_9BILA